VRLVGGCVSIGGAKKKSMALRRNPSWSDIDNRDTIATSVGATVLPGLRPPARPSAFASRERGVWTHGVRHPTR